jgi:WhiB family transcriptional regulator, redox-sensing transcriptional regulator
MKWRTYARCLELDLDERLMFFGDSPHPITAQSQYKRARLFCYDCPVQVDCLQWSLINKERVGVWGGLTESQRRRYAIPFFQKFGMNDETTMSLLMAPSIRPQQAGDTRRNHHDFREPEPTASLPIATPDSSDPRVPEAV